MEQFTVLVVIKIKASGRITNRLRLLGHLWMCDPLVPLKLYIVNYLYNTIWEQKI
jgi:hypothetical protein